MSGAKTLSIGGGTLNECKLMMKSNEESSVKQQKTMRKMNVDNCSTAERRVTGYLKRNPDKKLEVYIDGKLAYRVEEK